MPALDKYVIFAFSCILTFTVAVIIIFCITGNEPSTLVTCFFACMGGELLSLALIKRLKLRQEKEEHKVDNIDSFG